MKAFQVFGSWDLNAKVYIMINLVTIVNSIHFLRMTTQNSCTVYILHRINVVIE